MYFRHQSIDNYKVVQVVLWRELRIVPCYLYGNQIARFWWLHVKLKIGGDLPSFASDLRHILRRFLQDCTTLLHPNRPAVSCKTDIKIW